MRYALLALVLLAGCAPNWQPMVQPHSLQGWTGRGGTAPFRAEGEEIVGSSAEGSANTFLCTNQTYADFVMEFEVKLDAGGNSGVQVRSRAAEKTGEIPERPGTVREAGRVYGYQVEIADRSSCTAGGIYDEGRAGKWLFEPKGLPGACEAFRDGEWNAYKIEARGSRIQSWVNGVLCADFQEAVDREGFIALQVHSLKPGQKAYQVRWRGLRIREL